MDPLEIKTETPEFAVDGFHSFDDNEINYEEYEEDPLDVSNEQPEIVEHNFHHVGENGVQNENQENGDFSSELTLISVSVLNNYAHPHKF